MFDQIWTWIQEQVRTNDMAAGGIMVVVLTAVMYHARQLPSYLWKAIRRAVLTTVSFDEKSPLYDRFERWVNDNKLMDNKRNIVLTVVDDDDGDEVIHNVPDRRSYYLKIAGVWCRVHKDRDESGKAAKGGDDDGFTPVPPERYWLTCPVWSRVKVIKLLTSILEQYGSRGGNKSPVYTYRWYWRRRYDLPRKPLSSVALRDGQMDTITDDMELFLQRREWYHERQIPYQRGYILTGPPGTGKTSLVQALASHFKLRLCVLDLGGVMDDGDLKEAFLEAPSRSIILVEDFDSFFDGRKVKTKNQKITFSGFLNAVNGVVSNNGRILVMTTNIAEQVDPALTRVGRIDRSFHLGYVDRHQVESISRRFFGNCVEHPAFNRFLSAVADKDFTPADLIGHFQGHEKDPPRAFDVELLVQSRDERNNLSAELRQQADEEAREAAAAVPQVVSPPT